MGAIDLNTLSQRESEQVEWKENVADVDDVVATLAAFANDWANLGGGYVVCGAREGKDEHGFPRVEMIGLTASRIKEVEGRVVARCRDRVSPSIAPIVEELRTADAGRRILVFTMPSTRTAHTFRRGDGAPKYYVRISRETIEARNGIYRELLVRKGEIDEWDRRTCPSATVKDLDLLALRDALQRMDMYDADRGIDYYLSDTNQLHALVPPLLAREPLTGTPRPRNFTVLLFAKRPQVHIPGAYSLLSIYPGLDRSAPHAERKEFTGTLIEQAKRLSEALDAQSYTVFDKTDPKSPNANSYPRRALQEAMINALAHRNYELVHPARLTIFADRIEILSPGTLLSGISLSQLKQGKAAAKWRNQSLAWFLSRLQLAQGEGQGIPTILRSMRAEGCPPPRFEVSEADVTCLLPAHPRHVTIQIQKLIDAGNFDDAQAAAVALVEQNLGNGKVVELLAQASIARGDAAPIREVLSERPEALSYLSPASLIRLAAMSPSAGKPLYLEAAKRELSTAEMYQVAMGLAASRGVSQGIKLIDGWIVKDSSVELAIARGCLYLQRAHEHFDAIGRRGKDLAFRKRRAEDVRECLDIATVELNRALAQTTHPAMIDFINGYRAAVGVLRVKVPRRTGSAAKTTRKAR